MKVHFHIEAENPLLQEVMYYKPYTSSVFLLIGLSAVCFSLHCSSDMAFDPQHQRLSNLHTVQLLFIFAMTSGFSSCFLLMFKIIRLNDSDC